MAMLNNNGPSTRTTFEELPYLRILYVLRSTLRVRLTTIYTDRRTRIRLWRIFSSYVSALYETYSGTERLINVEIVDAAKSSIMSDVNRE